jgi:hypothetical protein
MIFGTCVVASGNEAVLDTLRRHVVLQPLVFRAGVLFVAVHLILSALGVVAETNFANPAGVIILMTILGAIDLRRRSEVILWANLGYGRWLTWVIYGSVGIVGEVLWAVASGSRR